MFNCHAQHITNFYINLLDYQKSATCSPVFVTFPCNIVCMYMCTCFCVYWCDFTTLLWGLCFLLLFCSNCINFTWPWLKHFRFGRHFFSLMSPMVGCYHLLSMVFSFFVNLH
uniref:(northern house mosquito) hypothetical protein n=1 Tax=Culex pipiens TaxID=7175 RepID=A0A8D8ESL0_CULPI